MPEPAMSQFRPDQVKEALAAGQQEGYHCRIPEAAPTTRYCSIWLHLTPGFMVVSAARLGPKVTGEDPVKDAAILLNALDLTLPIDQR